MSLLGRVFGPGGVRQLLKPCRRLATLSEKDFDRLAEETLQDLGDFLDRLPERVPTADDFDVSYAMGVLTLSLDGRRTYVLNKQTPNRQIWLSSPFSGPQRFDHERRHRWVYKRSGESLHRVLDRELAALFGQASLQLGELE